MFPILGGDERSIRYAWVQDGRTALMCASESGQTDCARLLLDAGADINAKDKVRVFRMFRTAIMQNILCLVLENDIDSPMWNSMEDLSQIASRFGVCVFLQ